jgi:hypothetical protein
MLQPDDSPEAIRHYSQHFVDLIDLEDNAFQTLPVNEVLTPQYHAIRFLAQLERDGYFATPLMRVMKSDIPAMAITFHHMLQRTPFVRLLSETLRLLEQHYHTAVDVEFTVQIPDPSAPSPDIRISLLQCRPQSSMETTAKAQLPEKLSDDQVIFSSRFVVPQGFVENIRYVIFVPPENYFALPTESARNEVGRIVGRLNSVLERKSFICVGPGRWGTANMDLGVYVGYADICHAAALVELSGKGIGIAPEFSLGTHFFQDLMEEQIYPVAVPLDGADVIFNRDFFYDAPNCLAEYAIPESLPKDCIRLIKVDSFKPGCHIDLIMDDEKGQAIAFLAPDEQRSSA